MDDAVWCRVRKHIHSETWERHMGKNGKKPVIILRPKGRASRSPAEIIRAIKEVAAHRKRRGQPSVSHAKK
jgi:hypothetical protein